MKNNIITDPQNRKELILNHWQEVIKSGKYIRTTTRTQGGIVMPAAQPADNEIIALVSEMQKYWNDAFELEKLQMVYTICGMLFPENQEARDGVLTILLTQFKLVELHKSLAQNNGNITRLP